MSRILFIILCALCSEEGFSQAFFQDISAQAGINNAGKNYGVAIGDYNNDGKEDIYISRHTLPNLLYRNNGDNTFTDVALQAGVAHGGTTTCSVWGDIDNDGDLDLYLGNRDEANILYRNNGNGTFTDISMSAGVNTLFRTRAVLFGDIDQDGYIDLYVANMTAANYMFRNNGDNTFTDITASSNTQDFGIAMGSLFFDYDNDGDLDLYLTHDANQPYILYQNDGTGRFTDVSAQSNTNYAGQGMGVDVGDMNNDGFLDIYITNLYENTLLLNNGDGTFSNITAAAGVGDLGMGWGTLWMDCENDGLQDIYVSNDSYFSPYPNLLYQNKGDNTFQVISHSSPLSSMYGGYGVATADFNADGRADLFLANSGNDGNQLFINLTNNANNWVKVKLSGTQSNRAAIGARVEVEAGGKKMIDEVIAGASYASQNSLILHFGLGNAEIIDRIVVRWPSGLVEEFEQMEPNTSYLITEGESVVANASAAIVPDLELNAFPSPFTDKLQVCFKLEQPGFVKLTIRDVNGKTVAQLAEGSFPAGRQALEWTPPAGIPSGMYFCHFQSTKVQKAVRAIYVR
ncbi:MAG: CRTAC1 family protein [Phaeodactylibacter sp.]|nr:CRTAC1 family protein [Phaeodactylibacter sp.]MCB9050660.1 CRTAC1 family protein [Lewinellaceae bacterium]